MVKDLCWRVSGFGSRGSSFGTDVVPEGGVHVHLVDVLFWGFRVWVLGFMFQVFGLVVLG